MRHWNTQAILLALRAYLETHEGRPPLQKDCKPCNGLPSHATIRLYFGDLSSALYAVGLVPPQRSPRRVLVAPDTHLPMQASQARGRPVTWSKDRILEALDVYSRKHPEQRIRQKDCRSIHGLPALRTIERVFGCLSAALAACDPTR